MERLLCIKIASRGDLLLAAPAFQWLRQNCLKDRLTLLVGRSCEDVARHLPFFDEVEVLDDRMLMAGRGWEKFLGAHDLFHHLRGGFSEVFIFHRDWRYSVLAWLAGIPIRVGFDHGLSRAFLTHAYRANETAHHTAQYLGVAQFNRGREIPTAVRLSGLWRFEVGEEDRCVETLRTKGFYPTGKPWIALGFGGGKNVKTRTELKKWPIERYRQLARVITEEGGQVLWLGDEEDERALGTPEVGLNLAGRLRVVETAAALLRVAGTITNDTLILHLSEMMGAPTVAIFGPTEPAHYKPLGALSSYFWAGVPCSPCHRDGYFPRCQYDHRCMTQISVSEVFDRVRCWLHSSNSALH